METYPDAETQALKDMLEILWTNAFPNSEPDFDAYFQIRLDIAKEDL